MVAASVAWGGVEPDAAAPAEGDSGSVEKAVLAPAAKASKRTAAAMKQASNALDGMRCKPCGGAGTVTRKRDVGRRTVGRGMSMAVQSTYEATCETCDGVRIKDGAGLRPLALFVEALDRLDRTEAKAPAMIDATANDVRKVTAFGLGRWARRLNGAAKSVMAMVDPPLEKSFVCVGRLESHRMEGDARLVRVRLSADLSVEVRGAAVFDAEEGEAVLLGGTLERIDVSGDQKTASLRNGFVVADRSRQNEGVVFDFK